MIQVDHVVARPELREALECDGAAEAAATAEPALTAEDLVVGQDPERRLGALEDETSRECADREGGLGRTPSPIGKEFIETF
jgi:hypothetical protein